MWFDATARSDLGKTLQMNYATVFVRFAVGISFLSAVADRFGFWGAYGRPHVAWGNFGRFTAYTGSLLWFLPATVYPAMAWTATAAEIVLGFALIIGLFTRVVAFLSGILLLMFALTMVLSLGIKAPLDFSVFSASAGAFLLATFGQHPWSLDRVRQSHRHNRRLNDISEASNRKDQL
jgi:uncharacterized membrane protein YphA (DoxX/SURF4 family)